MQKKISVRLDDNVRQILESEALAKRLSLSAYICEIATVEARRIRRESIRKQSQAVAEYIATSAEAGAFYEDWGSSSPIVDRLAP